MFVKQNIVIWVGVVVVVSYSIDVCMSVICMSESNFVAATSTIAAFFLFLRRIDRDA